VHRIVEFDSEGTTLRGRLYEWTEVSRPRPVVIMAHGFSATITGMVADRFAEVFYDAGFTVLLYDHRSFGISDGAPRCEIDAFGQARGYRSAIDFAAGLRSVDPDRIALWGDSLSGGAVIAAGAVDPRVAAVVAQVPACGAAAPPHDPGGSMFDSTCRPFLDCNRSTQAVTGKGPMPVVSFDQAGTPSLLTPITAYRWFIEYGGRHGTNWVNQASVVAPSEPASWQPVLCAAHLQAPSLFVIASDDEMPGADPEVARMAFENAPQPKEVCEIEGGHFGLLHHPSALFDLASSAERSFLLRYLG
jgi:uncharacterized protein